MFLLAGLATGQDRITVEDLKARSDAGDKSAMRQLAELYYLGRGGVQQDFGEAARWYARLASQGDARAQASLGLMYARGYGVPKDLAAAHRWWSFAAAQNDPGAQYEKGGPSPAPCSLSGNSYITRTSGRGKPLKLLA